MLPLEDEICQTIRSWFLSVAVNDKAPQSYHEPILMENYGENVSSSGQKLLIFSFSASKRGALFPNSPSSDWQFTGYVPIQVILTICRRPHGKFHLQHPPIPSSAQAKWVSGYWRTENCWTYVERHLLGLDRTPVITVKWNYLISSQNAPSAVRHSLLIVSIQLMQRLEAARVLTSGRTELPEFFQINLIAVLPESRDICMHLECIPGVDYHKSNLFILSAGL